MWSEKVLCRQLCETESQKRGQSARRSCLYFVALSNACSVGRARGRCCAVGCYMPDCLPPGSVSFPEGLSLPFLRGRLLHQRRGLRHHRSARPETASWGPTLRSASPTCGSSTVCSRHGGDCGSGSRCGRTAGDSESIRRQIQSWIPAVGPRLAKTRLRCACRIPASFQARCLHARCVSGRPLIRGGVRFPIFSIGQGAE